VKLQDFPRGRAEDTRIVSSILPQISPLRQLLTSRISTPDPTATRSIGAAKWQRFVSPKGVRQDTAHSYLHPLLSDGRYPNLHVVLRTTVSRVLFDDNKHATEVECHNNQGDLRIHVKKLVVIAAGAFGSPQILERSGLGGAFLLGTLGIPVVSDLPQVGQSYQVSLMMCY